jgi:anthranilate synthase component 1
MEIIAKENSITVLNHGEIVRSEENVADPMSEPERISSKWKPVKVEGLPDTFCGKSEYFRYPGHRVF